MRRRGTVRAVFAALALIASLLSIGSLTAAPAAAAGGAYTLNFAAADPSIYLPPIPFPGAVTAPIGRGDGDPVIPLARFNDGATDVKVESLAPQDMALGQIVPFETLITVSGDTTPENGVITFVIGWNTLTTNGDDFGYDARADDIGYGVIAAFIDTGDGAHVDANDDATVDSFTWSLINDEIVGVFTVSGLDDGDSVVLEPWLVLDDTISAGTGGNVQSRLIDAATGSDQTINVANSGSITLVNGDSISTGNQTVPLLRPSDFFNAEVDLSITKSDDVDPVDLNGSITYTVSVTNAGPAVANSVVVYDELDPNTTFVSASDGGSLNTDAGDTIPDGAVQWNVGALAPGESAIYTVTVTVNGDAPTDTANGEDLVNTVTATTISDDTDPTNDTATEPTDVLFPAAPELGIEKVLTDNADQDGSGDVSLGDTLAYSVTATNNGNVDLTNVVVSDDLTGDSITCPLVASGDTCVLNTNYVVTVADVDAGVVENIGTADSDQTDPVTDPEMVPVTSNPSIAALKELLSNADEDVSGDVSGGDTLTYRITATNDGDVTLTDVTVDDDLTGTVDAPCAASLAPGEDCTVDVTYVVTAADVEAGEIVNTATVEGNPPTGAPVNDSDDETLSVAQNPALSIDKVLTGNADEDGSGDVSPGDTLSYSITATNSGDITLTTVVVSDDLTGDSETCATLAPGADCVLLTTYQVAASDVGSSIVNTGTADSDQTDPVTDDETVPVPAPGLAIDKVLTGNVDEDGSATVTLGDTLQYTLTATNTGGANLTNVVVSDDLTGDSITCPLVAPGDTCVLTTDYQVDQADVDAGQVDNVGTADSDQTGPVTDPETVPVEGEAAIDALKVYVDNDDADTSGTITAGDTLTYTIVATNDGDLTLTDVTVDDDLTGTVDAPCAASLAPGEDCTVDVTYLVSQADVDAGEIFNTATVEGNPPTGDPVDDSDDETVLIPADPSISALKVLAGNDDADVSGDVSLGDTLTFTITATNDGNVTLTDVTVDDDLTGTVDAVCSASLAPDASCSVDVTYVVTQADVDAGVINNTGTVEGNPPTGAPVTDSDDETVPVPQTAALGVDKALTGNADEDGSLDISLGDTLEYIITATNDGNVTLANVVVADDLTGTSTTCATVAPDQTCVLVAFYTVTEADIAAGEIVNTGSASSDQTPQVEDPNTQPVPTPGLAVDKVLTGNDDADGSGDISLGDTLSYTLTATNNGTANLTNVTVEDSLTGDAATCNLLAPGQTCILDVTYTVTQDDVDAGEVRNIGEADSDQTPPTEDPNEEPVPQNPSIEADKVLNGNNDADGNGEVSLGDTLTFRITATNNGNVTLTDVTVDDDLTGTADAPCAASLAPGESCFVDVPYVVTQSDVDDGKVENTGTVEGNPPTGAPVTDSDPEEVPVPQNPNIEATKVLFENADEDVDGEVSLNDTLTYRITAENTGNVTLTGVSVSDNLTGTVGAACAASLAPGQTCFVDVTYVVTQADVDAGQIDNTGTVEGTPPVGDPVTDSDDEIVDVPQNPALSIDKLFSRIDSTDGAPFTQAVDAAGDLVVYEVLVANVGNVTLTDVVVTDPLLASVSCPTSTLLVNQSMSCFGSYVVPQGVLNDNGGGDGDIDNTATADSNQTDALSDSVEVPLDLNPAIIATKVLGGNADEDASTDVSLGDTLTFDVVASNAGNVTLTNVTVDDDLTGTVDEPCAASLAPGESCEVNIPYTVTQADVDAGQIENVASVEGTPLVGDPVTDDDPEQVDVPQRPAIEIVKTFSDDTVTAGGAASSFTLVVTNTGNVTLSDAIIEDAVDGRLQVNGVSGTAGADSDTDGNAQTVEWLIPSLAVDGTVTVTVDFTVDASVDPAVVDNVVNVMADGPLGDPGDPSDDATDTDDDQVEVVRSADLSVSKDDGVSEVTAGDGVTYEYTITVANDGPSDADDVVVADTWPAEFSQGTVSASQGSCSAGPSFTCDLGTVAAGGSATITVEYTVPSSVQAGSYTNSVSVSSSDPDPDSSDNSDADTNDVVTSADLSVSKDDGVAEVTAGDGVTYEYTITVANDGPSDADEVTVTEDSFPAGFDMGAVASSQGSCAAFPCNLGTIAAGSSASITLQYTVPSDTLAGFETNTVSVTSDDPDPDPSNNSDDDTNEVLTDINLAIVKTFDPASVPQGSAQSFTIVASNDGPSDAIDVAVTDLVDASLEVAGVSVTSGVGDCSASAGQEVDCTVQLPAGESVTVTVEYLAFPFLSDDPVYGTNVGDEFRIVFVNGSVLEGSTDNGPVLLDGVDITNDVGIVASLTRNDIVFDPPGSDPAFEIHLSCSDPFTGGWGQSGGPVEGVDENWQVSAFTIARYNPQGFLKKCGNVVNDFDVPNTAFATGTDSSGTETVSDGATVTVTPGITLDRLQTNGKRLTARLTNFTGENKVIADVSIEWPSSNGNLTKIRLDNPTVWSGTASPTSTVVDATDSGWSGGTLLTGQGILRFDFRNKSASSGYVVRVTFTDGTFLDIMT